MKSFFGRKTRICRPERIFEELEARIVLDASVDSSWHDDPAGSLDVHGSFTQALTGDGVADGAAPEMAAQAADTDFNVVLISDALPEQDMLVNAASEHAQVLIFDSAQDNLDTINVRLHDIVDSSGKKIDNLAVLDHAKAGEWRIGTDRFSLFSMPPRRASFEALGSMLSADGQIQLYGCALAGNPMGQALVDRMALYTQADVFASFDKVGGGSRHQEPQLDHTSVSLVTSSQVSVDEPASLEPLTMDAPQVDTPRQPLIINLGDARLLHFGHSFAIDDADPSQHVTATVAYDPRTDNGEGITELKVKNTGGSSATIVAPGPDSDTWTISGSVEDVNKVLGTMRAVTAADYAGEAHVTVATVDPDSHALLSSQTLTVSLPHQAAIDHVQPSAPSPHVSNADSSESTPEASSQDPFHELRLSPGDPPVIRIGAQSMSVHGEDAQSIPEIEVYDPGSRFVDVVLSANNGTLSAPNPLPRPGIEVRGNNGIDEPVLRLSGLYDYLNDTLKQVTYKPAEGYAGSDDLTVQVHSRGGYSNEIPPVPVVEKTLPIDVENP